MAFLLDQFDVMEHLWSTIDKTPDGNYVHYDEIDVHQLYINGFVDAEQFTLKEWMSVFEPFRQADGTFLLNKDNFLALDPYRYKGEVRVPFDAMKINEGKYTDEGLDELISASIAPSCKLSPEKLKEFFDTLKKDFRQADGLILIKADAKTRIRTLLDSNPSPLRNLELLLDHMISERGTDMEGEIDRAELDAATMQAAKAASSFSETPTTKSEEKAIGLEALTKARKGKAGGEIKGKDKTELKKIRRSRKGMRG